MKKKNFIIIGFIIVIALVIQILFPVRVKQTINVGNPINPIELKDKDSIIEQTFTTDLKKVSSIGIRFSTYSKKNKHGKIKITLKENNNKKIIEKVYKLSDISDNSMLYLNFKPIEKTKGNIYKLIISYDEYYNDIKLATWIGGSSNNDNYLKLNNKKQKNNLFYSLTGYKPVSDFIVYILIILGFYFVLYGCMEDENNAKNKK